jgi:peptide chain release factor 1
MVVAQDMQRRSPGGARSRGKKELIDRLDGIARRHREIEAEMAKPEVASDHAQLTKLAREQRTLRDTVQTYEAYRKAQHDVESARELQKHERDTEMQEYLRAEEHRAAAQLAELDEKLKVLLLPKDPNDDRDVVVEIQGAEGGEEAALFAGDLFRMYTKWAERKGWKVDVVEESPTEKGGFDKVVFEVHGHGAYSQLKFEGGVHRVQRVPKTEAQGRIHTSAATVAVMPEADPVEVELKPEDIEIKTSTSQGPGGQSVNTTYSAIRITHKPTGMMVSIQDEKSQLQNKEKALRVLRARLYEIKLAEQQEKIGAQRRGMVGTGSRSEKIRTYNFKESRVTDHRIKLTLHRLDSVMNGDLDELVAALVNAERAALLEGSAKPE